MDYVGHKNIKRFTIEGIVADDSYIPFEVHSKCKLLCEMMEDAGYAPVLDYGPFWSTSYVADEDIYEFKLTGYAIYVGRRRALSTYGIVNGQIILKDSAQDKPSGFYEEWEYE